MMDKDLCKQAAAEKAVSFIQDNMAVGLGTGSTTAFFIEKLIERCKKGLKIKAIASSEKSLKQAREGGIPLADISSLSSLDIYVDGADEVDPQKQMIKGAGGALVREKIAAHMSREVVIIIDESKLVKQLGTRPLPVEIIPFGHAATIHHLNLLGYKGSLRKEKNNALYLTDNHNLIYDVDLSQDPHALRAHTQITSIPGVVETGFFVPPKGRIVIGFSDGRVVVQ
jgi:ribose 5-phosphate isomerase A